MLTPNKQKMAEFMIVAMEDAIGFELNKAQKAALYTQTERDCREITDADAAYLLGQIESNSSQNGDMEYEMKKAYENQLKDLA